MSWTQVDQLETPAERLELSEKPNAETMKMASGIVAEKPKKKVNLEGVRSYTFKNGNRRLSVTAATGLLFELHNMSDNK